MIVDLNLYRVCKWSVAFWVLNYAEHFPFRVEQIPYILIVNLYKAEP